MRTLPLTWLLLALAAAGSMPASAADPCGGFKWDIAKERALFAGRGETVTAGKAAASAPTLGVDRLYRLILDPEPQVMFPVPSEKKSSGAYAGLATLRLGAPGYYKISVDAPVWMDVVADGKLVAVTDFQGQHECDAPRKIVEFDLTGATQFVLQVSGAAKDAVSLTVTQASAP